MFELDFEAKTFEAIEALAAVLKDPALPAYEPHRKALLDAPMWLEMDVTCGDCIEGGGCHGETDDEDCGCARHEASVEARERRTALIAAGVMPGSEV